MCVQASSSSCICPWWFILPDSWYRRFRHLRFLFHKSTMIPTPWPVLDVLPSTASVPWLWCMISVAWLLLYVSYSTKYVPWCLDDFICRIFHQCCSFWPVVSDLDTHPYSACCSCYNQIVGVMPWGQIWMSECVRRYTNVLYIHMCTCIQIYIERER